MGTDGNKISGEAMVDGKYSEERFKELVEKAKVEIIENIETLLEAWKAYSVFQTNLPAKLVVLPMFREASKRINEIEQEIRKCEEDIILGEDRVHSIRPAWYEENKK